MCICLRAFVCVCVRVFCDPSRVNVDFLESKISASLLLRNIINGHYSEKLKYV